MAKSKNLISEGLRREEAIKTNVSSLITPPPTQWETATLIRSNETLHARLCVNDKTEGGEGER